MFATATGSRNNEAEATLSEPTSPAEKTNSPLFMRIKDVPQIRARSIKRVSARALLFVGMDMD
jgi:hypothetical protein